MAGQARGTQLSLHGASSLQGTAFIRHRASLHHDSKHLLGFGTCCRCDQSLCARAGRSLGEQSPLRGQSSLPGASSLQAALSAQGASPLQPSALPSSRGSGPRIYVGGIPTAVSETMIRQHFSQWGQV